jgi:hypothetical protein
VLDVGLPVEPAVNEEAQPPGGFGEDVELVDNTSPAKLPFFGLLFNGSPWSLAGEYPGYLRFVPIYLEPVLQESVAKL